MKNLLVLFCLTLLLHSGATARQSVPVGKIFRTQILVIGGDAAGIGAAMQSAQHGMKTMVIEASNHLGNDLDPVDTSFTFGLNGEYQRQLKAGNTRDQILKQWTDTVKNLSIRLNTSVSAMQKTEKGWDVTLSNSDHIEALCIVESSKESYTDYKKPAGWEDVMMQYSLEDTLARTSICVQTHPPTIGGPSPYPPIMAIFSIKYFLDPERDNFIVKLMGWGKGDLVMGQLMGSLAASSVLKKGQPLDIRFAQRAMLRVGSRIADFYDRDLVGPHFQLIQRVLVTGILRNYEINGGMPVFFFPDRPVDIKHIRTGFAAYYPKSQHWFESHTAGNMTISDVLELFRYVTNQGEGLNLKVQADWQSKLGLPLSFDTERLITRHEFAVLLDTYLNPFDVKVDLSGKIMMDGR